MVIHINPNGDALKCVAKPGNCPYGAFHDHFSDINSAMETLDKINKQISKASFYGIGTADGWTVADERTGTVVARLVNLRTSKKRIENIAKRARTELRDQFSAQGIKSANIEGIGRVTVVKETEKNHLNQDKFNELADKENYEKDRVMPATTSLHYNNSMSYG